MRMLEQFGTAILRPEWMGETVPVNINAAAHWLYETTSQEHFDWHDDFPRVAGPWPLCWMEWTPPRFFNSEGEIHYTDYRQVGVTHVGCMIETLHEPDDARARGYLEEDILWEAEFGEVIEERERLGMPCDHLLAVRAERRADLRQVLANEATVARFIQRYSFFFGTRNHGAVYLGQGMAYLDNEGAMIAKLPLYTPSAKAAPTDEVAAQLGGLLRSLMHAPLFALSLMHCKNVQVAAEPPTPAKVAKKRAKKGIKSVTYKTLLIDPLRRQVRREIAGNPRGERSEIKQALHIVRGHFATYTPDAPLFGRYAGTFWKPMHVRGHAENGRIVKDYQVRNS